MLRYTLMYFDKYKDNYLYEEFETSMDLLCALVSPDMCGSNAPSAQSIKHK